MDQLSVIIPTINEENYLEETLQCLQNTTPKAYEIIVVDGGSTDQTLSIASRFPVKIINSSQTGRAAQMNAGAAVAQGNHLCFLHADTLVPRDFVLRIRQTLENPRLVLGGFVSIMRGKERTRWFTSWLNYIKTHLGPLIYRPYRYLFQGLRLLFGDQVMFCRRDDFMLISGFDETLPIMEEADFCLRINKLGHIRQISYKVYSSDRRLNGLGFWKAHCIYVGILILWALGASPHWLKKFYEDIR
ncbi:TIGR04283 family arsenosugar biosynthesis glycosyltransferase [Catalinimonas niigatensis]|uniref:TIGR04283 family arsenosugar biosynthesis glycosyltransferase n=1 Tax=Catalinimonas niigatensis TaxID=1397264 RepID=UPI002665E978|nr:TIGR04283 family arsenosugar biosynthesis glycosyltransferase [Catalinimonas niigatensis]WPP49596.1 TIGR04283 family arsenosugar biosynthesis glycosyltransferase [Catalinimonas niigatensis]